MAKCLIIIPAYNEADNIEKVVDNIIRNYPQYDYIVVNDGSTDDTAAVCLNNGFQVLNLAMPGITIMISRCRSTVTDSMTYFFWRI